MTEAKVALIELDATVTVRVVVVTPVLLVDVVVVVVAGVPLMTMLVKALIAGGGVVLEPVTVVPLPAATLPLPASADWPHKPTATSNRGRAVMRIERAIFCLGDFMMVQP